MPTPNRCTAVPVSHLLIPAKNGSQEAQYAIILAFENLIVKLLQAEKDPLNQEDLRQDLNVGILEAIRRYPGEGERFPGYVKKILVSLRGQYVRQQVQQKRLQQKLAALAWPRIYFQVYPALEAMDKEKRKQKLKRAFSHLTREEKVIIQFRFRPVPLSWRDIGRKMGKSHNQIYWTYQQILKKLRIHCI